MKAKIKIVLEFDYDDAKMLLKLARAPIKDESDRMGKLRDDLLIVLEDIFPDEGFK